ncbi:MAG: Nif3-like dinuclear metal center hexameric protein [Hydrogenophilus sp.]|nr:Nif3-like dinuclear metal center hexameric protein [Hydrogenophilus sp.]
MEREGLVSRLDELLEAARFKDYCPNGLQVEGRAQIHRIVCGVSATLALVEEAIAREADALLVHHGWFWRGNDGRIVGLHRRRLARLLAHEINLIAYHLPLDAHPILGNNAQLARRFGWRVTGRFGEQEIGFLGEVESPASAREIADRVAKVLGREPLLVGEMERPVRKVAWASGAAQGWFEEAIGRGVDLYLSGEISEPTVHLARESGVVYLAAGHHATERYGVMAVGEWLTCETGVVCEFVDLPNPV